MSTSVINVIDCNCIHSAVNTTCNSFNIQMVIATFALPKLFEENYGL